MLIVNHGPFEVAVALCHGDRVTALRRLEMAKETTVTQRTLTAMASEIVQLEAALARLRALFDGLAKEHGVRRPSER
jgi:hypothetical protein